MSIYRPPLPRHRQHLSAWLLVVAGLGVALLASSLVSGARSATSTSGLIAFTRADGIYVMRADGSGAASRIFKHGPRTDVLGGVAWSPDGSKLAFASWKGIWVMDAQGRNRVRLASPGEITNFGSATWSPDGRRIAFTAYQGDDRDIWIMNADGSNQTRLRTTPLLFEGEVDWSPTGGWLVLDSGSWISDVYLMRTDGTNLRNLTPGGGWVGSGQPSWSPDGQRIAYGRASALWVMDARGRAQTQLSNSKLGDAVPDWSPDGRRIVFIRGDARDSSTEIYVMSADGTGVTRLTHNRLGEGSPAWRPVSAT